MDTHEILTFLGLPANPDYYFVKCFIDRVVHMNPVRKGLIEKLERWRWSNYNNFSLDPSIVTACPIQVDYVHLPDNYHA